MAPVIIEASAEHTATIIFSHGLGDSAQGWVPFAQQLKGSFPHVKWILTNAPKRLVTVAGQELPAWFDVRKFNGQPVDEDTEGMLKSVGTLFELVEGEVVKGIKEDRIVVGGFSQGAILSLIAGVTSPLRLGGILALSGYLGLTHEDKLKSLQTPISKEIPFFWAHGEADQMINYAKGQLGFSYLNTLDLKKTEWHGYPGLGHSLGQQETQDIKVFLQKVIA